MDPISPNIDNTNTDYVNATEYQKKSDKLRSLVSVMDELHSKNMAARRLRYTEIDIEKEKTSGKMKPDEVFVPQHIIDANIRREQSSYIQFVAQSNRAVVMVDKAAPANDTTLIERDVTNRLRYEGWQLPMFANIDGMQQNGYGALEIVLDERQEGNMGHEFVQLGDLGLVGDTRNVQDAEMVARNFYCSRTDLMGMVGDDHGFDEKQVELVVSQEPDGRDNEYSMDSKDKSLYKIQKVMFRVNGTVYVAWASYNVCNDWLRAPRPLYIGRRELVTDPITQQPLMMPTGMPQSKEVYETMYPFYIFPYLISENNTISQLKGRAYLDQDTQTAATSLLSSYCTAHRRAAGAYFSKDSDDPNADVLMQKNIYFQQGALINQKIKQFQLAAPSADMVGAINLIVSANQSETSKVNFAAQNRKDSRKTATEIQAATQEASTLSTVQVVLFSNSLRGMYNTMYSIVRSRVQCGLIKVDPMLFQLYGREYIIKPSGDTDVVERQQRTKMMMDSWPVMQATPAAQAFLSDLLMNMFPDYAPKYIQIFQQAEQAKAQQPPQKSPEQLAAEADIQAQQAKTQMDMQSKQAGVQLELVKGKQEMAISDAETQQKLQHNEIMFQQDMAHKQQAHEMKMRQQSQTKAA